MYIVPETAIADILTRAVLSDEFADATGSYFDNDSGRFADPHRDALDSRKSAAVVQAIEDRLAELSFPLSTTGPART